MLCCSLCLLALLLYFHPPPMLVHLNPLETGRFFLFFLLSLSENVKLPLHVLLCSIEHVKCPRSSVSIDLKIFSSLQCSIFLRAALSACSCGQASKKHLEVTGWWVNNSEEWWLLVLVGELEAIKESKQCKVLHFWHESWRVCGRFWFILLLKQHVQHVPDNSHSFIFCWGSWP